FEEMLFAKLMLNQAEIDSVEVSDDQVESEMDRRLNYFIQQIGSRQKLEEYYKKSILEIKDELRKSIREQMLIGEIQRGITSDETITPSEVNKFYRKIPEDSLPLINSELQFSEIVVKPQVTKEEKEIALEKITALRERIVEGNEKFTTLARLYSEDPGSAKKGGELGEFGRGVMYPEFEAASFALENPNEVSEIIRTKAGYHIIQLIERKGEYINVRHILIQTKPSSVSLQKASNYLDSIYRLIESGKYTFEEAAKIFSESDTKVNGGLVTNSSNGSNVFLPSELDQRTFFTLNNMSAEEISKPVLFEDEEGEKAYRLLKMIQRTKPHKANLSDDYARIKEMALESKKNDKINEWISEKSENTPISVIDEKFRNCKLQYNWF
ncbi:MAG: peptidylprolyl isomerase, partial [Patescibacteria group bacterium]|nr:peptidylprolyl isomerase [Patescibacteria group bacterium]